ncbi:MAG: glycosyltransferase [Varibaculum cambriense]|uniref:glycosyltransferase n=1 Tax=Varibaculum cambriense TaxID=184870 RepID=UPI00290F966A|nr:glycosyltransferase [Varibaculum cambriense]MDU4026789.1 glycosyltransferase [Varibaculum cambriense]
MACASEPTASYQHPSVQVFIATRGLTPYLKQTLTALRACRYPITSLVVVDTAADTTLTPAQLRPYAPLHYSQVKANNLGQAVRLARANNLEAVDYLWMLHDDSAPDPECLGQLVQAFENSTTLGIAGPKALDWDKPETLASVGIHATRGGERLTPFDPGEVDQGQYDGISDVLAVGTAGLLIKAQLWDRLRGTNPLLGKFTEGLELGRRARMAGYRVCLVPAARIYHAQAGLFGLREYLEHQDSASGIADTRNENTEEKQDTKSPGVGNQVETPADKSAPLTENLLTAQAPSSPMGSRQEDRQKERIQGEEENATEDYEQLDTEEDGQPAEPDAPVPHQPVYVYDPVPVTPLVLEAPREKENSYPERRADKYLYRALTISSVLLPLWLCLLPLKSLMIALMWVLRSAGQRAAIELKAANRVWGSLGKILAARRIQRRQSQISRRELARLEVPASRVRENRRLIRRVDRESGQEVLKLGTVAKSQLDKVTWHAQIIAWLLALFFLSISLFGMRDFLGGMHGGFWSVLPGSWHDFWILATNSWRTFSTGIIGLPDPIAYPLLAITAPFAIFGIAPTTVLRWLLVLSPLGAGMGAWLASAALTRVNSVRALIALSWGAALPFLVSVQAGNIAAVLGHVFLPLAVWGIISFFELRRPYLLAGVLGTETYLPNYSRRLPAGLAALSLVVVSAAAPWLWLAALVFVLVCSLSVTVKKHLPWRRSCAYLGGGLAILAPALVTLLPSFIWALRTHSMRAYLFLTPSAPTPIAIRSQLQLWGQTLSGVPLYLGIAALSGVAIAAGGALFTGRELLATRIAWAFTLASVVIGMLALTQTVAPGQSPWLLSVFSVALMGLLVSTSLGWSAIQPPKRLRYLLASLVTLALVLPLATIATWALPSANTPLQAGSDRSPVAFSILSASEKRTRMLLIDKDGDRYQVAMRREAGPGLLATNWQIRTQSPAQHTSPESGVLAALVAGNDRQAATKCADLAVEQLLVTKQATADGLDSKLISSSYFHPVATNDDYSVWRLDTSSFIPARSDARVRIGDGKRQETVPAAVLSAKQSLAPSSKKRELLLAESASPAWKAQIAGRDLQARSKGGLQSFIIPAGGSGNLQVYLASPGRYLVIGLFLLVYLGAVATCLPLGDRRKQK